MCSLLVTESLCSRTTLRLQDENTNILASGGIRGEIRMFHPASKVRQ